MYSFILEAVRQEVCGGRFASKIGVRWRLDCWEAVTQN